MSPRQRRFIDEYLVDLNGTQAAIRAGYAPKRASNSAWRLLRRPAIAAAVHEAMAARETRTRITADRVLKEYARIAFADMRRVTEWGPEGVKLRPHTAVSEDDAAAIAEIASGSDKGGRGRIKLHDKKGALDAIARHLGLFGGAGTVADPQARAKAAARAREILDERLDRLARSSDKT
jgi:phage terminase small subunit